MRNSDSQSVLAPYRSGGIQKKQKKKQISRGQRVRHARDLTKAERIQDRLAAKVADAKSRSKKVQSRRALWEDINATTQDETRKTIKGPGRFDVLGDSEDEGKDDIQPFDGDTEIKVIDGVQVPAFATGQTFTMSLGPVLQADVKKNNTPTAAPAEDAVDEIT